MIRLILIFTVMTFATSAVFTPAARAMDRDVRAVFTTSEYGLLGGALLGLATYPFTKKPRGIALGASIGLYLGIAVGIYYISNRDEPGNPLRLDNYPHDRSRPEDQSRNQQYPSTYERPIIQADFVVKTF